MQKDKDHREQLDDFSEFMRHKLEDHRLPVDDLRWEEIESRMQPRRSLWIWWAGSSVVAAGIALLFLLLPFRGGNGTGDEALPPLVSVQEKDTLVDRPVPEEKLIAAAVPDRMRKTVENEIEETPTAVVSEEIHAEEAVAADEPVRKPSSDESTSRPNEKKQEKEAAHDLYHYESRRKLAFPGRKAKKAEGKWAVTAGFGTGGHVSLGLGNDYMAEGPSQESPGTIPGIIGPPEVEPPDFSQPGTLASTEYTDVDAALPLSFGVTVRRDFNRYVGLETGLVYTYLASNLAKQGKIQYKSHLELHYLGIPVNLVVTLWQNPRWNIYLSGGFMLEKGLRSKQTEDRFWQLKMEHRVDKRSIDGLQWSLNASAGISYRFYKDWSFYFEPRISHYFDNHQPVSIRTENDVIIGLGAGVRYNF